MAEQRCTSAEARREVKSLFALAARLQVRKALHHPLDHLQFGWLALPFDPYFPPFTARWPQVTAKLRLRQMKWRITAQSVGFPVDDRDSLSRLTTLPVTALDSSNSKSGSGRSFPRGDV
jgi:hypothetical protein